MEAVNNQIFCSFIERTMELISCGYSIENIKEAYCNNISDITEARGFRHNEEFLNKALEIINKAFRRSDDANTSKVTTLINEWNEHIAPILTGVTCNSFDEFAMQVAKVAGQCIDYKIMEEAMQQQPVQPQQNQMFVDVNTLISENNYLKSLNVSKDEEIKALKARLVALGQPV